MSLSLTRLLVLSTYLAGSLAACEDRPDPDSEAPRLNSEALDPVRHNTTSSESTGTATGSRPGGSKAGSDPYITQSAPGTSPTGSIGMTGSNGLPGSTGSDVDPHAGTPQQVPVQVGAPSPAGGATAQNLGNGEILHVLGVIHRGEIAQAALAKQLGTNTQVKAFADEMAREHQQAIEKGVQVGRRMRATMAESETSRRLQTELEANTTRLRGLTTADFDRQYMQVQVDEHRAALEQVQKMRAMTETGEIRAHLDEMSAAVRMHLQHAQQIQGRVAAR